MKYKTALPLLLVAVILISGCLSGVDAEKVREDALSSMEDVETYEYDMSMKMEMGSDETPGSISMLMDSNGTVDREERRMSMFSTMSSFGYEFGQEAYIINDTMYMKMDMGGMAMGSQEDLPEWFKVEEATMVSQTWESSSYAKQYKNILEISDVEYEGGESVNGENAHVLTLDPDIQGYNELLRDQMTDMNSMEGVEGVDRIFNEDSIEVRNVSLKYWISEETGHILRTQSNTTMTMRFGGTAFGNESIGVTMNADIHLSDHGEDVSIELPEGAENAEEFDSLFPEGGFGNFTSPGASGTGLGQAS